MDEESLCQTLFDRHKWLRARVRTCFMLLVKWLACKLACAQHTCRHVHHGRGVMDSEYVVTELKC